MARYMMVAADANKVALQLASMVPEADRAEASVLIAKMMNYGLRAAPRAVQSTVRRNAVERAVQGLPVRVSMTKVLDQRTGKEFNALVLNGEVDNGSDEE